METQGHTYMKGRGAQINPQTRFGDRAQVAAHIEAIDEPPPAAMPTQYFYDSPRQIVNKVDSQDVGMLYSLNPYQGCEHGCIYCYARNAHEYWGYSAGLDFEQKIIVKRNAPELLRQWFRKKSWQPIPIGLSGNTDCYQPAERKYRLTRQLLEVFLQYRNPVGIITKNALILRDLDLLAQLAKLRLVHVYVSITGLNEDLRQVLEPRTVTYRSRLRVVRELTDAGVPVGVMVAPLIPGLNAHEAPQVIEAAAEAGALTAGYTMVRLNGAVAQIFRDWLERTYPDRADKVWHQIQELHGGSVSDSRTGTRMRGEGVLAESLRQLVKTAVRQHMAGRQMPAYDNTLFIRNPETPTLF